MTLRGAATALLAALALATSGCGSVAGRLEKANALRHEGKPREALTAYREILGELGDGDIPSWQTGVRLKALKYAADISYLELGDYPGAISYYRRIVSLYPGTEDAWRARAAIGDIYVTRLNDRRAAVVQYAAVAQADVPEAPRYQLLAAQQYLELRNWDQARTEARLLRERWPKGPEAEEAELLTAQAWALEGRTAEALAAYLALVERRPAPALAAVALEGAAQMHVQEGRFDKALALYAQAMINHPNPDALRSTMERVRERREAAQTVRPGDRAAALDHRVRIKETP